jgi:large subunit ribosomal protein L29
MKYPGVSGLTIEELRKKTTELRGELFEARMKNQMGQLNNPIQVRNLRRDIARLQTALSQKLSR